MRRVAAAVLCTVALVGVTSVRDLSPASAEVSAGVGPEYPLADPVTAWHSATHPAVAGGADSALTVWVEEGRRIGSRWVAGSLVRADGSLVDPDGVVLGPRVSDVASTAVAWNGQSYLVVADKTICGPYYCVREVTADLVDAAGHVVRSTSVASTQAAASLPSVGAVGDRFLVAWRAGDGTIDGRVVGRDGSLSSLLSISSAAGANPAVGAAGSSFVVAWDAGAVGSRDIKATTVTPAGVVANPAGTTLSSAAGDQLAPAIGTAGATAFAVWQDHRGSTADVYGTRIAADGTPADAAGIPIATGAGEQTGPSIGPDGQHALVAWRTGSDVRGARLEATGTVLDPTGRAISAAAGDQSAPAVGRLAGGAIVAWQDARADTAPDVYGGRLSESGTRLDGDGVLLSRRGTNRQSLVRTAWVGDRFVTLWTEDAPSGQSGVRLVIGRSAADGAALDGRGRRVELPTEASFVADAVWNGSNFLVILGSGTYGAVDLKAIHVDADGRVLDAPFPIVTAPNNQLGVSATWNGSGYLVTWYDDRTAAGTWHIYAGRLDATGHPLDGSGVQLSTAPANDVRPAVAANGSTFLVVWQEYGGVFKVLGRRISSGGALLGGPVRLSDATAALEPTVAVNGSGWLAAWGQLPAEGPSRVVARRVGSDGAVTGAVIPLSPGSAGPYEGSASAVWDGRDTIVAWRRSRETTGQDIRVARVTTAGKLRDGEPIVITDADGERYDPQVIPKSTDAFAVVYGATVPGPPFDGATRGFLRVVQPK